MTYGIVIVESNTQATLPDQQCFIMDLKTVLAMPMHQLNPPLRLLPQLPLAT